ncbi:DUF2306 domain-containing protein [Zavarzinia sp. CC-PAN008]|uniref:DUF2306 domain-containing protein n=1 Tax=Zavarzinia sp. CC-PAN008 TaxID=3243332 RepID=UPI003F742A4A
MIRSATPRPRAVPPDAVRWLGWALFCVLAWQGTQVGLFALNQIRMDPASLPAQLRGNMAANPVAFLLHTVLGGLALLVAPVQFVPAIRRRWRGLHRWLGRSYVVLCLLSGLAAYPVAFGTVAGPVAAWGFATMATAWLVTTGLAWWHAWRRNIAAHRRWIIRSYALTLSAVLLRFLLWLAISLRLDFWTVYQATAWASWLLTLAAAELFLVLSAVRTGSARRMMPAAPPAGSTSRTDQSSAS